MTTGDFYPPYYGDFWPPFCQTPICVSPTWSEQRPKKITERFDKDGNLIERITEDLEFED